MKKATVRDLLISVLVASLIPLRLLIVGTFILYAGNATEFQTGYAQMLPELLLTTLGATLALAGILRLLRGRWRELGYALILGISLMLWIQASFLKWNYGVFDGRGLNWMAAPWGGAVDAIVWILVVGLMLVFARRLRSVAVTIASGLLALQVLICVAEGLQHPIAVRNMARQAVSASRIPQGMLGYSSRTNILHVVLDSLTTDIFLEAVATSQWQDRFQGFTVFTENMAVAPHTPFALPAIFLGEAYTSKETPSVFYSRAMRDGFSNRLRSTGYRVNLIPYISMDESKFDNSFLPPRVYGGTERDIRHMETRSIAVTALFVHSPHAAKVYLYNDGNWRFQVDTSSSRGIASFEAIRLLRDYTRRLHLGGEKPAYHFIHLMTPHPPLTTLPDGTYAGQVLPNTRENFLNQARAIIAEFMECLGQLEHLGIYDQTFILLQGDHGSVIPPRIEGIDVATFQPRIAALLAVKPFGQRGPLRTSNAPSSTLDTRATLLAAAGIADSSEGANVLTLTGSANDRARKYVVYAGRGEEATVSTYQILGPGLETNAWSLVGTEPVTYEERPYTFGETVQFGMNGNSDSYLGPGWSAAFQLGEICWSDGARAILRLPTPEPANDVELVVRLIPYVRPGAVERQRIAVTVNGTPIANWEGTKPEMQQFSARIPKALMQRSRTEILFDLPDAASPKAIGRGADARTLGVAISTLVLRELSGAREPTDVDRTKPPTGSEDALDLIMPGETVFFGPRSNGERLLGTGWSQSEDSNAKVTWSNGDSATIHFGVTQDVPQGQFLLTFIPYVVPEVLKRQRIQAILNGTVVADCVGSKRTLETVAIPIPAALKRGTRHNLRFNLPDAASPATIGQGKDLRRLGIAIHSLRLATSDPPIDGQLSSPQN